VITLLIVLGLMFLGGAIVWVLDRAQAPDYLTDSIERRQMTIRQESGRQW
jgi:hypothetical protein